MQTNTHRAGAEPEERPARPARPRVEGAATLAAERTRAATLLKLLGDDSPIVLRGVRAEFERLGRLAAPALRRAARHGPARVRSRARQLLLDAARRRAVRRLIRYAARPEHDLETALFLLDRHHSPELDMRPFAKALDAMGHELANRIGREPMGRRRALALIDYLANEIGFSGTADDYHHPDNIHVHRAIERRQGMPLTLCAIFAFVARRAGLRAGLLPFPGHVLLTITDGGDRTIIDPFGGSRVLTESHCLTYLSQHGFPYRDEWFREADDTAMFTRHVLNLINSCRQRARHTEAHALEQVLRVLSRGSTGAAPRGRYLG